MDAALAVGDEPAVVIEGVRLSAEPAVWEVAVVVVGAALVVDCGAAGAAVFTGLAAATPGGGGMIGGPMGRPFLSHGRRMEYAGATLRGGGRHGGGVGGEAGASVPGAGASVARAALLMEAALAGAGGAGAALPAAVGAGGGGAGAALPGAGAGAGVGATGAAALPAAWAWDTSTASRPTLPACGT